MYYVLCIIIIKRLGEPSTVPGRVEGGGQQVLSFKHAWGVEEGH